MKLSDYIIHAGCECTLVSDGEFDLLEQCTRVRGDRALTFLASPKFRDSLDCPRISCLLCTPELAENLPAHIQGVAVTQTPKLAFFRIHNELARRQPMRPTVVDPSARISPLAYIAPYNVVIGRNVEIQPFVAIGENTVIEDHVKICFGTIVSSQGFTSVRDGDAMFLAADAGGTLIQEGAEICGQCDIARGLLQMDQTIIGPYSKLDAKVHIGHGSVLGKRVLIPSGAHIAGNCVVGDDAWIGVNATVSNRITIGSHARVSLGAVVTRDVPDGATVTGNFAIDHQRFLRNLKVSLAESTDGGKTPPPPGQSEHP